MHYRFVSDKIYLISRLAGNKIYLKNEDGKELKNPKYIFEIQKVENIDKSQIRQKNKESRQELKKEQKNIDISKKLKREGIDTKNIIN